MPVIRNTVGPPDVSHHQDVWELLAEELRNPRPFGEPMVQEEEFPRTGLIGITVVWDRFRNLGDSVRPAIILKAYEAAGKSDVSQRAGFVVGYSVREALQAGVLPVKIGAFLGSNTLPERVAAVRQSLKEVGAPSFTKAGRIMSAFQTVGQARACIDELVRRDPTCKDIWDVAHTIKSPDTHE